MNLHKDLGEEFIAEAIKNDSTSNKRSRLIELQGWALIENFSTYWYSLRRELSINPNGCIMYEDKLYIPTQLRKTILDSFHKTQPGQVGVIFLDQLIWYSQIHRDIMALAQKRRQCTKTGKNLTAIIPKNEYVDLPLLSERKEDVQMDFAGPNNKDTYTLVTMDRCFRYSQAKTYINCDTETVLTYLRDYIKFHGIPRSIIWDQAQAFKAKNFEVFCTDNNIKLILAPTGDLRGTGMVERLIQTIDA